MTSSASRRNDVDNRMLTHIAHAFSSKGYHGTKSSNLGLEGSFSVATVYNRHGDKKGAFCDAVAHAWRCLDQTLKRMEHHEDDPIEELRAIGKSITRFACENPEFFKTMTNDDKPDELTS